MSGESDLSLRQKVHYESIHRAYEAHYYDRTSVAFREEFILDPALGALDLTGFLVGDFASGSGHTSLALQRRFPGLKCVGFDLSDKACAAYRQHTGGDAYAIDLTKGGNPAVRVDAAIIIGGLHHCVSDLRGALRAAATMVKPGGYLMMMEPNRKFLLQAFRDLWYRNDKYFDAPTEAALDHDDLLKQASPWFKGVSVSYMGGPAYYLILNSLILRVPLQWKSKMAGPLFALERLYNRLPSPTLFPYFVARWQRTGAAN